MLSDFPEHIQREIQEILDGAARRILQDRLEREAAAEKDDPPKSPATE